MIVVSCANENLNFYYDVTKLDKKGNTFIFRNVKGTDERQFRRKALLSQNDTLLITKALNEDHNPSEVFIENLNNNQSTLYQFYFIDYFENNIDTLSSKIISNNVYSFNESDYPLMWEASVDHKKFGYWKYRKKRSIHNKNVKYRFMDTVANCIQFHDVVTVFDKKGGVLDSIERYSFYAESFGLVGFLEKSEKKNIEEFKLEQIK